MPLRVELKPFERIIIGDSVIINSGARASYLIDGDTPIRREDTAAPVRQYAHPLDERIGAAAMGSLGKDRDLIRTSVTPVLGRPVSWMICCGSF